MTVCAWATPSLCTTGRRFPARNRARYARTLICTTGLHTLFRFPMELGAHQTITFVSHCGSRVRTVIGHDGSRTTVHGVNSGSLLYSYLIETNVIIILIFFPNPPSQSRRRMSGAPSLRLPSYRIIARAREQRLAITIARCSPNLIEKSVLQTVPQTSVHVCRRPRAINAAGL